MHTPGPWMVSGAVPKAIVSVENPGANLLGLRYFEDEDGPYAIFMREEDATLAASAPELLEMLKELVARRERVAKQHGLENDNGSDGRYARARAVIARAEGKNK